MYGTRKIAQIKRDYGEALLHHFASDENHYRGLVARTENALKPNDADLKVASILLKRHKTTDLSGFSGLKENGYSADYDLVERLVNYIVMGVMAHDPSIRGIGYTDFNDVGGAMRSAQKQSGGTYLEWLCDHILNDDIRYEDIYKIRDDLKIFTRAKKEGKLKGADADIKGYNVKTLQSKMMVFDLAYNTPKNNSSVPQEIWDDTDIVYDGIEGRIVIPLTWDSSKFWGAGTRWCVSKRDDDGDFEGYCGINKTEVRENPLYVFLPKATEHVVETKTRQQMKYASHLEDEVIRDFRDNRFEGILPKPMQDLIGAYINNQKPALKHALAAFLKQTNFDLTHFDESSLVFEIIKEFDDADWISLLFKDHADNYKNLIGQGKEAIFIEAVSQDEKAIKNIYPQTESVCLAAVKNHGFCLRYVQNQTEEICMAAVRQNGYALKLVKDQTEDICLVAVQRHGGSLGDVKIQTENICFAAVEENQSALQYVENKTDQIYIHVINALIDSTGVSEKEVIMILRRSDYISVEEAAYCRKLMDKTVAQEIKNFEDRVLAMSQTGVQPVKSRSLSL